MFLNTELIIQFTAKNHLTLALFLTPKFHSLLLQIGTLSRIVSTRKLHAVVILWCDCIKFIVQKSSNSNLAERHGAWVGWFVATFNDVVPLVWRWHLRQRPGLLELLCQVLLFDLGQTAPLHCFTHLGNGSKISVVPWGAEMKGSWKWEITFKCFVLSDCDKLLYNLFWAQG